jgi:hypothetical protein
MKLSIALLFILLVNVSFSQPTKVNNTDYTYFQLKLKKDTIDFVIADTNLQVKKPILLFCQGSQPVPLFFDLPEQGIVPVTLNNFDVNEMKKHYHIAVISMPKTPLIVGSEHLNKSYNYVLDTTQEYSYSPEFIKADFLENYIDRANFVLKYLRKQKWVDNNELIVAGHSQGSRVAVGIASTNKKVTKLGLFGYNPMRRIDQLVWTKRLEAENGSISWEEADKHQQELYDFYSTIQNDDSLKTDPSLISWRSFSKSSIESLVDLDIPIYIAFGSKDPTSNYCDLLPLYFIEKQKNNLTMKRYSNLEHNFFPFKEDGSIDYQNGQWKSVMNVFLNWSLTQ